MKRNLIYLYLQLKTLLLHLAAILAGTAVLAIIAGTVAFCGTKLLYQNEKSSRITVALVVEDDSDLMKLGLTYLESSDSINTFCRLRTVSSADEAARMLQSHQAAASIYFPEDFTRDILNGNNEPAIITFSSQTGIEQLLFHELVQAASRILGSAQTGIYSVHSIYDKYDFAASQKTLVSYINKNTMETALGRSALFEVRELSSTGEMSVATYYTATAILLLTLLSTMACGSFLLPEQGSLNSMLTRSRFGIIWRTFAKCFSAAIFFCLLWGIFVVILALGDYLPFRMVICLLPLTLLAVSETMFLFTFARNRLTGTLLTFFVTFLLTFASGSIVPPAFLPDFIASAGRYLPQYYGHQLIGCILDNRPAAAPLSCILVWSCIFFILTCLLRRFMFSRNLQDESF